MDKPIISVLMCTYNEKIEYIKLAIESILAQTFRLFEFVIIIDNPNNNEIINYIELCSRNDDRIHYHINERNIGLPNSLNKGLELCKADIIARMDADDIAKVNRLEKEYNFMKNNPEYSVVSTNKIIIDNKGHVSGYGGRLLDDFEKIKRAMKYTNIVLHPGAMFYKNVVIQLGGYRDIFAAEDYDLWLRVISSGGVIGLLDEPLMQYRMSGDNITSKNSYMMWCAHKYVIGLFCDRVKGKSDSYTKKDFDSFLLECGCLNKINIDKFNKGAQLYHKSRFMLSNKKYILAFVTLLKASMQHREILPFIFNAIKFKIAEKL